MLSDTLNRVPSTRRGSRPSSSLHIAQFHSPFKNIKIGIYKTVILPVVLYGCEIWSVTLRGEHRPRVFENMILKRIFGPKRDKVEGGWSEGLRNLHSSPSIIAMVKSRRMRCAGHVTRMGRRGPLIGYW
jgi:hypothetical protein